MTEKMLEREKYHETLREEALESDDGGDLEVIDDVEDEPSDEPEVGRTPSDEDASPPLRQSKLDAASKENGKGKGKAKADGTPPPILGYPPSETTAGKRKRPPMDPFAGLCPFSPPRFPFLSQPSPPFLFLQAMAMVRIRAPLEHPLTRVLQRAGRARKFEEFMQRTSVLRPRTAPMRLPVERTRRKDQGNDPKRRQSRERFIVSYLIYNPLSPLRY
jgi:hypothetical protein